METAARPSDRTAEARRHAEHLPGYVGGSLVATVHRRAGQAALLRDRRLELSVNADGGLETRMVRGVRRTG